jgi:uncharacterized membrane protein YbaN (DUF454 family)
MRATAKKIGILVVGWAFILFGIVGLILPILQGTLFLLIGLAILSSEYLWAHHLLLRIRNRFPSVTARLDQATTATHKWIVKVFHRRGRAAYVNVAENTDDARSHWIRRRL